MTLDFNPSDKKEFNKFSKLGMWYILALSAIVTVSVIGQILIQRHLQSQVSDSRLVNIAGTQRYKSQWIVKMSMLLYADLDHKHFPDKIRSLEKFLEEWKKVHYGLQHGEEELNLPGDNSSEILNMFHDIEPYFLNVYNSAQKILQYKNENPVDTSGMRLAIENLLDNETVFLAKMDSIVFQFDFEARQKVDRLSRLEYILLVISVIVIILEIFFVFRPTTAQVNRTINQLMSSEKNAHKLSKEIGALYASLEKSYEQISIINQPVDNPRLYAKADKGGNINFISDGLNTLTGNHEGVVENMRISDLFVNIKEADDWMDDVVESVSEGTLWQGELQISVQGNTPCWAFILITPVYNDQKEIEELLIMGSNITHRKVAERSMNRKNRSEIEKKINQQKFRSVLILEGQEEERKRIAMDIHDGIGQMLTSLKYQIEAIDLNERANAEQKISEIDQLIKQVIKEVRKVTFNLKPTVLGDYGLQAGLNVFIREIAKHTDIELVYDTSGEIERLAQKIEDNIFRIVQEAINNAIKYSEAKRIEVALTQSDNEIVITVMDEGKGFDTKIVEARSINIESGRGFFNMYERTEYVNGKLNIDSSPGKGTTLTLVVPVRNMVTTD